MNVLHVINSLGSGGAEKLLTDYLKYENKNEDNNHYLYLLSRTNNIFLDELKELDVIVKISKRNSIYNPLQILDLMKFIRETEPQVIHAHLFPTLYFISFISLIYQKSRFVFTEHNTKNRRMGKRPFRIIENLVYSRYQSIIAISEAVKANLNKWLYNKNPNIHVVHNGINLSRFKSAKEFDLRKELGLKQDSILLVMVARLSDQKDHNSVLEALSLLPSIYYLLLVGEGPKKKSIIEKSIELELTDRVIFLGYRSDVPEIYKSSNVAILYSHYEGFGISALEAVASSTPLVISDNDGLRDIMKSFDNVEVASSREEIANAILKFTTIYLTETVCESKGLHKYSIEYYSRSIESIYLRLLKQ
jgi:glycosyltransferase involved in cell wall biosynthesis